MAKILLVEDDKSLREIYGVRLLAEGYDIVSAGDGEEALAMAIKDRPDLIVSDVMMPKISGFDMLDILRSTTETKNIKVIMMTALSSEEQRQRGVSLGADRYLVKSQVGIEDVVRTVHEVLADAPVLGGQAVTPAAPAAPAAPRPLAPASTPAMTPPTTSTLATSYVVTPTPAQAYITPTEPALPEPTAPLTPPTPKQTLASRVIEPLPVSREVTPDFGNMMKQELSQSAPDPFANKPSVAPGSVSTNVPAAPPTAVPAPVVPAPAPAASPAPTPAVTTPPQVPTQTPATPAPGPQTMAAALPPIPAPSEPPVPAAPAPAPASAPAPSVEPGKNI